MAELRSIIVFHGRHFVRHLGICFQSCVKLLQVMSGVIPRNLKKILLYLKPFPLRPQTRHTLTHARTHARTHAHTLSHVHEHTPTRTRTQTRTHTHMTIAYGECNALHFA